MPTPIQWTDETWNPIRGCSLVSEGCTNCYAMGVAARFSGPGLPYEGLARRRSNGKAQWTGRVDVVERHMHDPLRWRKPRRIFVNSMSDLFHENVAVETIARVVAVMALAPRHTYQILTKRPEKMWATLTHSGFYREVLRAADQIRERFADLGDVPVSDPTKFPYPNVWLGVSVEHQRAADARIPMLLETPAAVRFLSCEPLLEAVDLKPFIWRAAPGSTSRALHWVIVGGESGSSARECEIAWVRRMVQLCRSAGTPVFVKQLGRRPIVRNDERSEQWPGSTVPFDETHQHVHQGELAPLDLIDSHGGDWDEWPEDLRVREFPRAAA